MKIFSRIKRGYLFKVFKFAKFQLQKLHSKTSAKNVPNSVKCFKRNISNFFIDDKG